MSKRIQLFRPYHRTQEVLKELKGPLNSGWTGLGPVTSLFEKDLCRYTGAKQAVFLNSGTAALHLAIKLLNLDEGKEVITTPLTFISTNHVLLYEKLKPVFCDVDSQTGCINEKLIEELITPNTGAIMVVHYGGMPANMDEINRIARTYNIPVIEDCAHALGSSYNGVKIGNSSNICTFSFHSVKALPICDGGAITTNNRLYDERLRKLRWLGIDKSTADRFGGKGYSWEYNVEEVGYKYHGNDILAAIGRVSMRYLNEDLKRRQEIVDMYREGLRDVEWASPLPSDKWYEFNTNRISGNHLFVLSVPKKDEFIMKMREAGIEVGCHYMPNTMYDMYDNSRIGTAMRMYDRMVSLPLHMKLTDRDVKYIIKTIKELWD